MIDYSEKAPPCYVLVGESHKKYLKNFTKVFLMIYGN